LSFGGSKLLSAGRGGAVITHSTEILQRSLIFNSRGNEAFPLSQLQAAALCPQLESLTELTQRRHESVTQLTNRTRDIECLIGLTQLPSSCGSNEQTTLPAYYKLPWILDTQATGQSRADFIAAIQAEGVPIDVGFRGFTRRSSRRCRKVGELTNSQIAADQTLLLHHPFLLEPAETIEKVAFAMRKVATRRS
jgi:dTDP-4-amino-4,6-dideoxygalactose transaminase